MQMMLQYGFVVPNNINDYIVLSINAKVDPAMTKALRVRWGLCTRAGE